MANNIPEPGIEESLLAPALDRHELHTPAFIYDEGRLLRHIARTRAALGDGSAKLLFALKAFTVADGLLHIAPRVDGFHASSLFEARLARQLLGRQGRVHLTTPGLRPGEFDEICELCDHVSFNSVSQWEALRTAARGRIGCGLRLNPQRSFVDDERYDPCRRHSKLGAPLEQVVEIVRDSPERLEGISGLLIHGNCDSTDFLPLLETVRHVVARLGGWLAQIRWINLGGGYLFREASDLGPLHETLDLLRSRHGMEVFFEPGASIVREAGYLVSTVLDIFPSEGKRIAVLDTSVNHMPEVFEYQLHPPIAGDIAGGPHRYLLAGATCLAGDMFGDYAFSEPLHVGSRLVFESAGAYSLVKAHMFNGVNLPAVYALSEAGELVLKKRFLYEDFSARWS